MYQIKRTIIACVILVFCFVYADAQHPDPTPDPLNSVNLTTVLPPAPNAFELTRYSGLPVNESTGSVSVSIPLGNVKAGKINVPINLTYNSGNGVMINQVASRTGIGWVLNAGGVITRTVYNNPDESTKWLTPPANMTGESPEVLAYIDSATTLNTSTDTQTDIFSFNFNGYNGQFYLKPTDKTKVVMISASNLKVTTNFNHEFTGDWNFMVTDPKGTRYYFGGSTATETSKTTPQGVGSNCGKNFLSPIPNAWYLTSIQHYTGETISFLYTNANFTYFSDVTQTMFGSSATYQTVCSPVQDCLQPASSTVCLSSLTTTGVKLSQIIGPYETVSFNYLGRLDVAGDYLLSEVNFYKKNVATGASTLYSSYDLQYVNSRNTSYHNASSDTTLFYRPFLASVSREASGIQTETHSMQYYDINGLPSRLSFAQDYWGYANGVNNQDLVPPSDDPTIAILFPANITDREANGSFAYKGLLSKITYPSGGTDVIQYEPNTVYETRTPVLPLRIVSLTQMGTGTEGERDTSLNFTLGTAQNIRLDMSCVFSGSGFADTVHSHIKVKLLLSGSEIYSTTLKIGSSLTSIQPVAPGAYTLKLEAFSQGAKGNVDLFYQPSGPPVTANYPVAGMRVAKNISDPGTGNVLTKKYVYASLDVQNQSTGVLRIKAGPSNYYSTYSTGKNCGDGSVGICTFDVAYSHPMSQLTYFSGGNICYPRVIELQDTLWNNGGIEHQYMDADPGQDAQQYHGHAIPGVPASNSGFSPGLEKLRSTFVTTGNTGGSHQYKIVNTVETNYVTDTRLLHEQTNVVVRNNWQPFQQEPVSATFDAYDYMGYSLVSQWIYADTVKTTTYDLAGANPVKTIKVDVYNNTDNLLVTETQTTGSDGILQAVDYKYPSDFTPTAPYPAMITANDIDHVIEQSYYKGGVFQEAIKTNYADFTNGVYEPASIQTTTTSTSNYDTRINFYDYNSSGGLLSQSKVNGPQSSYVWAYNNLFPVAEVKNAAATEIYYQNFEFLTGATISTTVSHTGNQSCNGGYTVNFIPPSGKSYFISWFQQNGTKWDYHQEAYTGLKTFASGTYVDDIAVFPTDAQLSAVAYDPVAGPVGIIDAKGETSTFEYDNFLRLVNVKDRDGNIVKHTDYHYQQ